MYANCVNFPPYPYPYHSWSGTRIAIKPLKALGWSSRPTICIPWHKGRSILESGLKRLTKFSPELDLTTSHFKLKVYSLLTMQSPTPSNMYIYNQTHIQPKTSYLNHTLHNRNFSHRKGQEIMHVSDASLDTYCIAVWCSDTTTMSAA